MGIIFGRTGTAEPPFRLLTTLSSGSGGLDISVRSYSPYVIASVPMKNGKDNNAFSILAAKNLFKTTSKSDLEKG